MSAADLGRRLLAVSVEKNLGEVRIVDFTSFKFYISINAVSIQLELTSHIGRS